MHLWGMETKGASLDLYDGGRFAYFVLQVDAEPGTPMVVHPNLLQLQSLIRLLQECVKNYGPQGEEDA